MSKKGRNYLVMQRGSKFYWTFKDGFWVFAHWYRSEAEFDSHDDAKAAAVTHAFESQKPVIVEDLGYLP